MHGRDELEALSFVGAESRFQSYGRNFCWPAPDALVLSDGTLIGL